MLGYKRDDFKALGFYLEKISIPRKRIEFIDDIWETVQDVRSR